MKIGIFGGTFNPPHNMHKNIAVNLIKNNYLDKVIFVPTGNRYNKKDIIDFKDRYNMVKLIVDDKNLYVSDYECKNTLTYTYQTLDHFKKLYPSDQIYFICGSDNLKEITSWKNYEYILTNYNLLVVKRNNDNLDKILKKVYNKNIILANIKLDNISSTYIRNNIDKDVSNVVADNVLRYINDNKLYRRND